jgi:hypothetical protein
MNISITQLYGLLSDKLDRETAESLTSYIEAKIEKTIVDKVDHLATKEDIANIKVDIADAKTDILKWTVGLFITLALMVIGLYFK